MFMGQQQVILLILVTLIAGIATIVGVNTMQKSHEASNMDAIRQQVLLSQNLAVAYYSKSRMLGGGGYSFDGLTLDDINLESESEDATYSLIVEDGNSQEFEILVTTRFGDDYRVTVTNDDIVWESVDE